jgi:hypothetical protein
MSRPLHEVLQRAVITDRHGLNTAVGAISYPPHKLQVTRLSAHGVAKPHALHEPRDPEVQRGQLEDPSRFKRIQLFLIDVGIVAQHAGSVFAE